MRISDWSSDVCSSDLPNATPERADPVLDFRNKPFAVRGATMAAAPLRLLLVFILLLSGLHNAAPAMAGMTHHATDSHLSHHVEPGHASDKDTQTGQQDAELHEIGRAHVWTTATTAHLVCRLPLGEDKHP